MKKINSHSQHPSPIMRVAIFIAAVGVARGDENRDALMSIYTSTGGANWHVSTNWGVGDDYCKCVLS